MCGLFGFSDPQHSLTEKQANALANSLARASAVRGQDATGISCVQSGKLRIFKRPKPATRMQLRLPKGTTQLLGRVRMTTQRSEKKNYNNHPFHGALPGYMGISLRKYAGNFGGGCDSTAVSAGESTSDR